MRRYLLMTLAFAALAAASIAAFLYATDPFAILRFNRTDYYPVEEYIRIVKPHWVAGEWDTALVGSSVTLRGLPPSVVERKYRGARRAFNFGIYTVTAYEARRHAEHVLAVAPIRRLLVEARPFLLGGTHFRAQFSEARLAVAADGSSQPLWRLSDLGNALFSVTAVERALHNLFPGREPRVHRSDGEARFPRAGDRLSMVNSTRVSSARVVRTTPKHLRHLRGLLEAACERRVPVDVYFPPIHAFMLESLYRRGASELEAAKTAIVKTVDRASRKCRGGAGFTTWDFMTFNPMTEEPFPAVGERMRNFHDAPHFTARLGGEMLKVMGRKVPGPSGFGMRLTPRKMEERLAAQRAARLSWQAEQPQQLVLYEEIMQGVPLE